MWFRNVHNVRVVYELSLAVPPSNLSGVVKRRPVNIQPNVPDCMFC
jgi:hypothetical protein